MNKKIFFVLPFVLISLVTGVLAGLLRIGWFMPMGQVAAQHGAVMVGSFLGTLICLERIVALKKKWMYVIPVISGTSLVFFYLGLPDVGMGLLAMASFGLVYIYSDLIQRFGDYYFYVMMVGAVGWTVGNIIMIVSPFYPQAAPWWIVFILFTVFGERLELSKFLPQTRIKRVTMILAISVFMVGVVLPYHTFGKFASGIGMVLIALWLFRYDIARISIKSKGIHHYTGSLLLAGYFWLIVSGTLMVFDYISIFTYDAMLHAFFLGFTFSMIFAHAPIIFPGVAGLVIRPFHWTLYIWAIILQISLALRVVGDILIHPEFRAIGGMLNAIVILLFFVNLAILIFSMQKNKIDFQN